MRHYISTFRQRDWQDRPRSSPQSSHALRIELRRALRDTPLLSGGVGFFTATNSGQTSYQPLFEPLLAAPIGSHFLVESRAILLESFSPKGGDQPGYDHSHFISLTYLQGDYTLTPHVTIVGGTFLIPFNTYNDRLSPIWIGNFQGGPLTAGLGSLSTGAGTGGMLSGSAISRRKYSVSYNAFFSSRVDNSYFQSDRSGGGRASLYLPDQRLEIGFSYNRLFQGTHENFYGAYVWWEPKNSGFQLRSEYARGQHAKATGSRPPTAPTPSAVSTASSGASNPSSG